MDSSFIPEDILYEVALNSTYDDIKSICLSGNFERIICNNLIFWNKKYIKEFDSEPMLNNIKELKSIIKLFYDVNDKTKRIHKFVDQLIEEDYLGNKEYVNMTKIKKDLADILYNMTNNEFISDNFGQDIDFELIRNKHDLVIEIMDDNIGNSKSIQKIGRILHGMGEGLLDIIYSDYTDFFQNLYWGILKISNHKIYEFMYKYLYDKYYLETITNRI